MEKSLCKEQHSRFGKNAHMCMHIYIYIYIYIYTHTHTHTDIYFFFFHHTTCESMCDTLTSSAANQGNNTVSVAQGGTATPGATNQLLPLEHTHVHIYIYIYIYIYI